jgi:hypothetical protein
VLRVQLPRGLGEPPELVLLERVRLVVVDPRVIDVQRPDSVSDGPLRVPEDRTHHRQGRVHRGGSAFISCACPAGPRLRGCLERSIQQDLATVDDDRSLETGAAVQLRPALWREVASRLGGAPAGSEEREAAEWEAMTL